MQLPSPFAHTPTPAPPIQRILVVRWDCAASRLDSPGRMPPCRAEISVPARGAAGMHT